MIKTIEFQKKIYAIIVKKNFKLKLNSIKFFDQIGNLMHLYKW